MPAGAKVPTWRIATQSVRGASHEQTGAPNQDAVGALRLPDGSGVVLAVADGHGDERHARSDRGSRFAIEAGIETVAEWLQATTGVHAGADHRRAARELPARIVENWRARVVEDVEADPPAHTDHLEGEGVEVLYGSTLIVAGIGRSFDIFLQIGDGDILAVAPDGTVQRRARGRTDLPTHLTESICQPDAAARFRVEMAGPRRTSGHALVMLSSDGYANSFVDETAFLKVGPDLKGILERHGIDHVVNKLAQWLSETSHEGSGDDISLALAWSGSAGGAGQGRPRGGRTILPLLLLALLIPMILWAFFPTTWSRLSPAHWPDAIVTLVERVQDAVQPPAASAQRPPGAADAPSPVELPPLP